MDFEDQLWRPTGRFHLEVFKNGELIELVDEPNLVVNVSKTVLAALVGGNVADNSIVKFGVGTNGAAPDVGNTVLTSSFTNSVGVVSYPAAGQVNFAFGLSAAEANGIAIREFGLLTTTNALFARKVRATALVKTADISFNGSWTITF